MSRQWPRLVGLLIVSLLIALAARDLAPGVLLRQPSADPAETLVASGVIWAQGTELSAPRDGTIAAIYVHEGDAVTAGQLLVQMDTALLDAQVAVATARVAEAHAGLRLAESSPRPGAKEVARAQLEEAVIAYDVAVEALNDASALLESRQELEMLEAVAGCEVEAAQWRLQSAVSMKDAAQVAKDVLQYTEDRLDGFPFSFMLPGVPSELKSAPYDWWQAWAGVSAAQAQLQAAEAERDYWRSVLDNPQELTAEVECAQAAVQQAQAAVRMAEAQLGALMAGPTEQELAVARSRLAQAEAAKAADESRRNELALESPRSGIVLNCASRPGEVVARGATLLTLADLGEVELTVYVPENRLGRVAVGQTVTVRADAYPRSDFEGRVLHISDEAEFTPRNIATKEERVGTVYAVRIAIANPDELLRPGMSADATLGR